MDKRIKKRWIEALRSGEYKQGRGQLREADYGENKDDGSPEVTYTYCCLGVLCDLFRKSKAGRVIGADWDDDQDFLGQSGSLADQVKAWAKLNTGEEAPMFPIPGKKNQRAHAEGCLVELNDTVRASFAKIATWIEKNL